MEIKNITNDNFRKYGRIVTGIDFSAMLDVMSKKEIPSDVFYTPSDADLEACPEYSVIAERCFGGMPIQIGYCTGDNYKLNALEYHRNSEYNIAATDMILLVGLLSDVEDDFTYDTSKVEAFRVPKGMMVQMYETTLHYAPCTAQEGGFQAIVVLSKDTNTEFTLKDVITPEDKLLAARNKWLIGHKDAGLPDGSFIGLKGENISIK